MNTRDVLREIAKDMADDATRFDGQPFNGRTVAEYFGNQGAAIAALARIVETLLQENEENEPSPPPEGR